MNNGTSKFFIVMVLIIAVFAALSDVLFTLLGLNPKLVDIEPPADILPTSLNEEVLNNMQERSKKYLVLSPEQFEEEREPMASPTPSETPVPTEL